MCSWTQLIVPDPTDTMRFLKHALPIDFIGSDRTYFFDSPVESSTVHPRRRLACRRKQRSGQSSRRSQRFREAEALWCFQTMSTWASCSDTSVHTCGPPWGARWPSGSPWLEPRGESSWMWRRIHAKPINCRRRQAARETDRDHCEPSVVRELAAWPSES